MLASSLLRILVFFESKLYSEHAASIARDCRGGRGRFWVAIPFIVRYPCGSISCELPTCNSQVDSKQTLGSEPSDVSLVISLQEIFVGSEGFGSFSK